MKITLCSLCLMLGCLTSGVAKNKTEVEPKMSYIDNGKIRLGVDLTIGGAITYLARSGEQPNLVNSHDWGRQIQMSFYSGPNPFEPKGKKPSPNWRQLGWNPIQSGDYAGFRSEVLDHRNDGKTLYIKCRPMQWPLDNYPGECTFELWFSLEENTVQARCRLNNARPDKTPYASRSQELPALYTNAPWYRLMTYRGDKPFTGDALSRIVKEDKRAFPWTGWKATENWAALVDDNDFGLGIWTPSLYSYLGGFSGKPGKGGPKDAPTGYIAPLHKDILDYNIEYEYTYTLIVGSLRDIRGYVYKHADRSPKPVARFEKDRQHWTYSGLTDTGWPIRGELDITIQKPGGYLLSPPLFWKATDVPSLQITMATSVTHARRGRIFFIPNGKSETDVQRAVSFDLKPDGEFHTYSVDLSQSPHYTGNISQLQFVPIVEGERGDGVKIRSITVDGALVEP